MCAACCLLGHCSRGLSHSTHCTRGCQVSCLCAVCPPTVLQHSLYAGRHQVPPGVAVGCRTAPFHVHCFSTATKLSMDVGCPLATVPRTCAAGQRGCTEVVITAYIAGDWLLRMFLLGRLLASSPLCYRLMRLQPTTHMAVHCSHRDNLVGL